MDEDPFDELRRGLRGECDDGSTDSDRQVDVRHLLLGAAGAVALALAVVVLTATRAPEAAPAVTPAPVIDVGPDDGEDVAARPAPQPAARVWPAEPVEVVGTEVRSGGHRWRVGEPGDLVAVGDWDCDGTATPAVVRPTSDRLYVFDTWATAEAEATAAPGPTVPTGVTSFSAVGCGRADVRTADGATSQVATATTGS